MTITPRMADRIGASPAKPILGWGFINGLKTVIPNITSMENRERTANTIGLTEFTVTTTALGGTIGGRVPTTPAAANSITIMELTLTATIITDRDLRQVAAVCL